MTTSTIGAFIIAIFLLFIVLKIMAFPIKVILKFIFNSFIGGIILAICAYFGILVRVEWWTVLLTGLFGVPGFALATIITMFM